MYSEVAVDSTRPGGRDYIEVTVNDGDDIIDLHAEDADVAVELRLTKAETLALIGRLTEALGVALAA